MLTSGTLPVSYSVTTATTVEGLASLNSVGRLRQQLMYVGAFLEQPVWKTTSGRQHQTETYEIC